jgi:hypothetical protein
MDLSQVKTPPLISPLSNVCLKCLRISYRKSIDNERIAELTREANYWSELVKREKIKFSREGNNEIVNKIKCFSSISASLVRKTVVPTLLA